MAKDKGKKTSRKGKASKKSGARRISRYLGIAALLLLILLSVVGDWFVHHPRAWLKSCEESWPRFVTDILYCFGNRVGDVTDGLGWTGSDAVYTYDEEAPSGAITFAGCPERVKYPAPEDIQVIVRNDFIIGWSKSLRHPVWCAYHVKKDALYDAGKRPSFLVAETPNAPHPTEYTKSGFDRGHMVPNYAIATRYGPDAQRETFRMNNIAPQRPALNRGVWRDIEHRIAELWTAKYGEIWVVVGAVPNDPKTTFGNSIDVPRAFYQVIIAQDGFDVRALAIYIPQNVGWNAWAARHIISINELEEITGLNFNPNLPYWIQTPLEAQEPTRLWPVRFWDIFKQITFSAKPY